MADLLQLAESRATQGLRLPAPRRTYDDPPQDGTKVLGWWGGTGGGWMSTELEEGSWYDSNGDPFVRGPDFWIDMLPPPRKLVTR